MENVFTDSEGMAFTELVLMETTVFHQSELADTTGELSHVFDQGSTHLSRNSSAADCCATDQFG